MPRLYEVEMTRTTIVQVVAPDEMSSDDVEVLIKNNTEEVFANTNLSDDICITDVYDVTPEEATESGNFIVTDDGSDLMLAEDAEEDGVSWLAALDEVIEDDDDKETLGNDEDW